VTRRIPSLDGLRAVSITMVMVYHMTGQGLWSPLGNLGVRVFFVISGYLITGLLLQETARTGEISLIDFYKRRALRIFPPFYVYLLFIALLGAGGFIALNRGDIPEAAFYVINYFPGASQSVYVRHIWSLAIEEQFYILWPGLLRFGGRKRALQLAAAFLVAAPALRLFYWLFIPAFHDVMDRRFETVADALATGCVLAGAQNWLREREGYNAFLRSKWFYLVPFVPYLTYVFVGNHPRLFYTFGITIVNIAIAICIDRWVQYPDGLAGTLLNSAPFRWVGLLSYSIYLWQQPFLDAERNAFYNRFPWNLLLAAAFSLGSFFLIERPVQKLRARQGSRAVAIASRSTRVS
jgi:peptidoglycan/LPS O-acetylase OafA/YrhL